MKILLLSLLIVLSGCTRYVIERPTPDGIFKVSVMSSRSFDQPDLHYTRTGSDATFDFKAASANDGAAEIVGIFAPIIAGLMNGTIQVTQTE